MKKTLLINESTHTALKLYCNLNSIKINEWVDKLILDKLKSIKNDKKV